jgi:Fic family protein
MNYEEFRLSPAGRLAPTVEGQWAFVPNPLPPNVNLGSLVAEIATASARMGELAGVGGALDDPYMLIRPLQRKEAVASSSIEGTLTSLSDLMKIEAAADAARTSDDAREVQNYIRALEYALKRQETLPISLRLIREIHAELLRDHSNQRGGAFTPGEFRRDQNRIGGSTLAAARYVPPPLNELAHCLDAFEKYLHTPPASIPVVVDLALIHYQFEAIHPFPDGNGRVGRLLIPLILCSRKAIPQPLLYLSPYFEKHRDEYIDRLLEVSRIGDWIGWIGFFLTALTEQATDTISKVRALQEIQARYRARLQKARASALTLRLIDFLISVPVVSIPNVQAELDITYRAAQKHVERLVTEGILIELENVGRPRLFGAHEIFDVYEPSET